MQNNLNKIANYYGLDSRFTQTVEELSELIQAICKCKRFASDNKCICELLHNIYEEIADVEIMTAQLKLLLNAESDVEEIKKAKIQRQLERIEQECENQ